MTIPPDHPKNEPDRGIYNVRALLDGLDEGRDPAFVVMNDASECRGILDPDKMEDAHSASIPMQIHHRFEIEARQNVTVQNEERSVEIALDVLDRENLPRKNWRRYRR